MKKTAIAMSAMLLPALLATSCGNGKEAAIPAPSVEVVDGMVSPEVLEAFARISEAVPSPDGQRIAFTVGYESIESNSSNSDIYIMNRDGSDIKQITQSPSSESNLRWLDDDFIAFVCKDSETGKPQMFSINKNGSQRKRISKLEGGVSCFEVSPTGDKVLMGSTISAEDKDSALFNGLPLTTGRVVNDLMYKHWDEWVTDIPHPFIADFSNGEVSGEATDILAGKPWECPMKPFGGSDAFAWAPDGKSFVLVYRALTGKEYAFSTNSDIYLYDVTGKLIANLSEGNPGYDTNPVFSPDGKSLAWLSMATDKFESDKKRLMVMDVKTRAKRDLTKDWDRWPEGLAWTPDSKSIVFNGYNNGTMPIFRINAATARIDTLADADQNGYWDYVGVQPLGNDTVLALRHSMRRPNEVCIVANGMKPQDITAINEPLLKKLKLGGVRKEMVPTTDGKLMTTWIITPPDFDPNKKYPAILYCQGGPQQAVSQFWSYRWNFMIMAANGYIVIAPNRRGLPGFGEEWNLQISKDYGGQNMRDYFSAVDYMKDKYSYIDADRIGAIGASYGGFSVYWLAGHHEGRFRALVAHAGIFNMEAQYLETEEMWFADFDMGGAPWEVNNEAAQRTFANSPHKFVDKWTAPILVTVGELDYRILASQGMMAFNAAKMRGLEAEMLVFPDENHWVLKPQNAVLWQRTFFQFLDKYLKNPTAPKKAAPAATTQEAKTESTDTAAQN